MPKKVRTIQEKEKMLELGKANEKLRWFFVAQPFKCKLITLDGGWYSKIGTKNLNDKWLHSIKHKRTGDTFTISDVDYLKIIDTFESKNKHLL